MKVKLRKIGNSIGILLSKESIKNYKVGDVITIEISYNNNVITNKENVITEEEYKGLDETTIARLKQQKEERAYYSNSNLLKS